MAVWQAYKVRSLLLTERWKPDTIRRRTTLTAVIQAQQVAYVTQYYSIVNSSFISIGYWLVYFTFIICLIAIASGAAKPQYLTELCTFW